MSFKVGINFQKRILCRIWVLSVAIYECQSLTNPPNFRKYASGFKINCTILFVQTECSAITVKRCLLLKVYVKPL